MTDTQQSADTSSSETWIAIIFWFVIIAVGAFAYFKQDRADVLLDVSTQPELVSGMVTFAGTPVSGGVVHVVVSEARSKRYLTGATLPVSNDGTFTSQEGHLTLGIAEKGRPLHFSAEFRGTLGEKGEDDSEVKSLSGGSTLYLNSSPPLGDGFLWFVTVVAAVLVALTLVLFTGSLSQRKARWLFILMYCFTFGALALPIVLSLVVAQNPYLVESMEDSPIGLVKAKATGLSEPQWLINIGGRVDEDKSITTTAKPAPVGNSADEAGTKTEAAAGAEAGSSPRVAARTDSDPPNKIVEGGVAVPFYVVLLAMFGAGINMTLKVPQIQRDYEDVLLPQAHSSPLLNPLMATWRALRGPTEGSAVVPADVPRKKAGDIRRELIENYMYLLSAPFLAIAMYYLLQVLAEQVTQPVLVLMAFATGLVSKAVIRGIIVFAESKLPGGDKPPPPPPPPSAEVTEKAAEAKARETEAEAAGKALDEARGRQTEAEAEAKAAEEAVHKAEQKQAAIEAAVGGGRATQAEASTAKEEAEKATQEAAAKQVEVEEAARSVASAAQEAEAKQAEARVAASAAQEAEAKQAAAQAEAVVNAAQEAAAKQTEARAVAEATEEVAQEATEKQAEAEAAVKATVQPAQVVAQEAEAKAAKAEAEAKAAREATPPRPETATDPTEKD